MTQCTCDSQFQTFSGSLQKSEVECTCRSSYTRTRGFVIHLYHVYKRSEMTDQHQHTHQHQHRPHDHQRQMVVVCRGTLGDVMPLVAVAITWGKLELDNLNQHQKQQHNPVQAVLIVTHSKLIAKLQQLCSARDLQFLQFRSLDDTAPSKTTKNNSSTKDKLPLINHQHQQKRARVDTSTDDNIIVGTGAAASPANDEMDDVNQTELPQKSTSTNRSESRIPLGMATWKVVRDVSATVIIYNLFAWEGQAIAEKLGVPSVALSPFILTRPPPTRFISELENAYPQLVKALSTAPQKSISLKEIDGWFWRFFLDDVGDLRSLLGLSVCPFVTNAGVVTTLPQAPVLLYGVSNTIFDRPSYWPDSVHVTGYWHQDLERNCNLDNNDNDSNINDDDDNNDDNNANDDDDVDDNTNSNLINDNTTTANYNTDDNNNTTTANYNTDDNNNTTTTTTTTTNRNTNNINIDAGNQAEVHSHPELLLFLNNNNNNNSSNNNNNDNTSNNNKAPKKNTRDVSEVVSANVIQHNNRNQTDNNNNTKNINNNTTTTTNNNNTNDTSTTTPRAIHFTTATNVNNETNLSDSSTHESERGMRNASASASASASEQEQGKENAKTKESQRKTKSESEAKKGHSGCGDEPVYVGFGSMETLGDVMTTAIITNLTRAIVGVACETAPSTCASDDRAPRHRLLVHVHKGSRFDVALRASLAGQNCSNVFILDYPVRHYPIFRRCKAIVHHGGAGTIGSALLAGKAQIVVPFMFDQHEWGERLKHKGLCAAVLDPKKLSKTDFSRAISSLSSSSSSSSSPSIPHNHFEHSAAGVGVGVGTDVVGGGDSVADVVGGVGAVDVGGVGVDVNVVHVADVGTRLRQEKGCANAVAVINTVIRNHTSMSTSTECVHES